MKRIKETRTDMRDRARPFAFRLVLAAIYIVGIYASWIRFSKGLGAATNLSDQVPWGLWIWFNLSEIAICASGFILCALYFIFNIERLKPVVRPAILGTLLGYSLVAATLLYDIGLPLRFWHPLVFWNFRSVMLEVTWCILLYLGILAAEMSIPVTEGLGFSRLSNLLKKFCVILSILGAVLSILHQSSLGALFLIVPEKLNALWYSPWLPWLFLASALVGGVGFIMLEMALAGRFLNHEFPPSLYRYLARILSGALIIYLIMVIADFTWSEKWPVLLDDSAKSAWYGIEFIMGILIPCSLLFVPRVRASRAGLIFCAALAVAGVLLNRLNVTVIGFIMESGATYFPAWPEFAILVMVIAFRVSVTAAASQRLPIFET
jgi:Ni/Fe-hydrogenase subunit HybB-like protein